jgi:regulator of sigma E protease
MGLNDLPLYLMAVAALGVLIFVHELGHFLVARLFGVKVEAFSLGFGRELVGLTRGDTRYKLCVFPLGGYVKLAGEYPEEGKPEVAPAPDEFLAKPWWVRSLVLLAGPGMNFIFPVLLLFALYATVGKPLLFGPAQVQSVVAGKPAALAGVQVGDQVVRIHETAVANYDQMTDLVDRLAREQPGKALAFTLRRGKKLVTLPIAPLLDGSANCYRIGVTLEPGSAPMGRQVDKAWVGMPAEKAGFRPGDEILKVGGRPLDDGRDFPALFAAAKADPVAIEILREGRSLTLTAAKRQPLPEGMAKPEEVGLLGLELKSEASLVFRRVGIVSAAKLSVLENTMLAAGMVQGLWSLATGQLGFRESVGGPITIIRMARQQAESGLLQFLDFSAKISIMLCIMNLLPIPLLDGGTLLLALVEGARRKPLPLKAQGVLQYLGLGLIGALMVFAIGNDLVNLVTRALQNAR